MASHHSVSPGSLVAIGGAEDRTSDLAILTQVFSLAPRGRDDVTVIAAASSIPDQILPVYKAAFERLGARRVHLLAMQDRKPTFDPETVRAIERSGVIFFTGGDQLRLTKVMSDTPALDAIRQCSRAGTVVAGTSAGAAALPSIMIYGGAAEDALRKEAVDITSGLALIDGMIIDSHFLQRGRFTRLMEVGAVYPACLGVGLGEDAAVIIHANGVLEAIGPGHVIIVDSRDHARSNIAELSAGEPVAIENMIIHALVSGHGFDIGARRYITASELDKHRVPAP